MKTYEYVSIRSVHKFRDILYLFNRISCLISVCLTVCLSVCWCICLSVCLLVYLSVCLSACLSLCNGIKFACTEGMILTGTHCIVLSSVFFKIIKYVFP